jgi:pimeloyl-ACP methyl ester carboxylesterase
MPRYVYSHALAGGVAAVALSASWTAPAIAATACADLPNLKIAASEIGLPSGGASIISAQVQTVPADPTMPGATREYCKVLGAIAPVDPNAPPVNFEVNLPTQWNGKAVQYGGGGSNGTLITGLAPLRDARRDTPVPVARGFATWGTDSGHDNKKLSEPRAFALNDESLLNMAYASYKKTHDVGRRIAAAFYDRAPSKIYYYGGSEGGREALMMAQRFPADFDGIVSVVPVANYTGGNVMRAKLAQLQHEGGWINPAKAKLIHSAVNTACDKLDGLEDGVISAYEKCLNVFDVKTLRCANGADTGDTSLSDKQIEADRLVHRPFQYPFAMKNGVTSWPGWTYGSEVQPGGMIDSVTGAEPPQFPIVSEKTQSVAWANADGFVRYFFARDAKFNPFNFSAQEYAVRIREISDMFDTTDPDLSAFLARGGKLILKGNGADYQRSILQEITYYKSVVAKIGQARVDSFVRFYTTPGVNHPGNGVMSSGAAVPAKVDLLGALDGWVDTGKAPGELMQVSQDTKAPFKTAAARPMCLYPAFPRYKGEGDPNEAASFSCAKQ